MKKFLLFLLSVAFLFLFIKISYSDSFHFGIISAVEDKVEEIQQEREKDKPVVAVSFLSSASKVSGLVDITAETTNVIRVEIYIDGVLKATDTTDPFSYSLDTSLYSNGVHTVEVKAYNAKDQETTTSYTITVDNDIPPSVNLQSLDGNTTFSGIININAEASDDKGISKVEFYLDGSLIATDTYTPFGYNLDTTKIVNGAHIIEAKAYDTANQMTSAQHEIMVRNALSVSLKLPAKDFEASGIMDIVPEVTGAIKVEFYVDGELKNTNTSAPYVYSWDTTKVSNQSHIISVSAYSEEGLGVSSMITVLVNNVTPNTIRITSPANGSVVSIVPDITVDANMDKGIVKVKLYIDGEWKGLDDTFPYLFPVSQWPITFSDGIHTFKVVAHDAEDNTLSDEITITTKIDNPPTVSIIAPANGSTIAGIVDVVVDADDDKGISKVEFSIDNVLQYTDTTAPYICSWDTVQYDANTSHSVMVKAYDTADQTASDVHTVSIKASQWNVETVDSLGNAGLYASLAVDSINNPHIAYYGSMSGDDLKYAKWTGTTWDVKTVDSSGDVGLYTSLAIDISNNPHIAYFDISNTALKYARWMGTTWNIETVDSIGNVGWYASLSLDDSDNPHIAYCDDTSDTLKYAKWTGTGWIIETVDTTDNGVGFSSLSLDSDNNPHIAYYDRTNSDLKYASWTGIVWDIQTVDSIGDVGSYVSLSLDDSNNPHIAYYDITNTALKYSRWTGSAWNIETVDSTGDVGLYASLALDASNNPHIAYCYGAVTPDGAFKYARWTGTAWVVEVVETTNNIGDCTFIALESNGNPHVAYRGSNNYNLKYAIRK